MAPKKGINKKASRLTTTAMAAACAALFSLVTHAYPIDGNETDPATTAYPKHTQTNTPLMDSNNPTLPAPYGKPFLLESGVSNVAGSQSATAPADANYTFEACSGSNSLATLSDSEAILPQSKNFYGNGVDLPFCLATFKTKQACPATGFVPVIKLTPTSVTTEVYIPIFACIPPGNLKDKPYYTGVQDSGTGGYSVEFATPAASSGNGAGWEPFVSVTWETWCYPTVERNTTYSTTNQNPPPNESCNISNSTTADLPVLLWDVGSLSTTSSNNVQTFNINRACPIGWNAYVVMKRPSINANDQLPPASSVHQSVGTIGVCVTQQPQKGSTLVSYLAKADIMTMTYDSNSLTVNDTSAASFTNLHWELYCYPPNAQLPPVDTNCTTKDAPYK